MENLQAMNEHLNYPMLFKPVHIHVHKISSYQKSLDLILKRQRIHTGYYERFAYWYGDLNSFLQSFLIVMTVSTISLIGFIFGMGNLLGCIALAMTWGLSLLLNDSYKYYQERDRLISADINELEQCLEESLEHFRSIGGNLAKVLESLSILYEEKYGEHQEFQEEVLTLKEQIESLNHLPQSFAESKLKTVNLNESIDELDDYLSNLSDNLKDEVDKFNLIIEELNKVQLTLKEDRLNLGQIIEQYGAQGDELCRCIEGLNQFSQQISELLDFRKNNHEGIIEDIEEGRNRILNYHAKNLLLEQRFFKREVKEGQSSPLNLKKPSAAEQHSDRSISPKH